MLANRLHGCAIRLTTAFWYPVFPVRTRATTLSQTESRLFILLPVHNRRTVTQRCLEQLRAQQVDGLVVVVIDDGSTDGTGRMVREFSGLSIEVVQGDGSLWWGGAMAAGMRHVDTQAAERDRVLMLNDDVELPDCFFSKLMAAADEAGPDAMIGCAQRDLDGRHPGYIGYEIDYRQQSLKLLLTGERPGRIVDVDGLAGRGVLFSVALMRAIGYIDAARFPHYWGDIEYTARARDLGFRVTCVTDVRVATSFAPSDGKVLGAGWRTRFFSPVSSRNVRQRLTFWRLRGPGSLRRTAVLRYGWLQFSRAVRRAFDASARGAAV